MSSIDLDATEPTIQWPACINDAPEGWRWGRHVSLGVYGTGYYLIRESDGATLIAIQRPDLNEDDIPNEDDLTVALTNDTQATG